MGPLYSSQSSSLSLERKSASPIMLPIGGMPLGAPPTAAAARASATVKRTKSFSGREIHVGLGDGELGKGVYGR